MLEVFFPLPELFHIARFRKVISGRLTFLFFVFFGNLLPPLPLFSGKSSDISLISTESWIHHIWISPKWFNVIWTQNKSVLDTVVCFIYHFSFELLLTLNIVSLKVGLDFCSVLASQSKEDVISDSSDSAVWRNQTHKYSKSPLLVWLGLVSLL